MSVLDCPNCGGEMTVTYKRIWHCENCGYEEHRGDEIEVLKEGEPVYQKRMVDRTWIKMLANGLEEIINEKAGERIGFALLLFPFGSNKDSKYATTQGADYVSNAQRPEMIKFLRETADRLELTEDIGPEIGEA